MPNGDCDCASAVPWRHLDECGHVPSCANWIWPMLWQERLTHNLTIGAGLCRAHDLGAGFGYEWATREPFWPRWEPGCKRDASEAEEARRQPGAFADIYGDRSKWRALDEEPHASLQDGEGL